MHRKAVLFKKHGETYICSYHNSGNSRTKRMKKLKFKKTYYSSTSRINFQLRGGVGNR